MASAELSLSFGTQNAMLTATFFLNFAHAGRNAAGNAARSATGGVRPENLRKAMKKKRNWGQYVPSGDTCKMKIDENNTEKMPKTSENMKGKI